MRRRTLALNRLLLSTREGGRRAEQSSSSVLYVVMGSVHSVERSLLQHRTWCRHARCAFVTEDSINATGRYDTGMRLVRAGDHRRGPGRSAESCCANATSAAERTFFCSSHRRKTMSAQYRFLPALQWAKRQLLAAASGGRGEFRRHGGALRWVALVDDDSFVFPRSMHQLLRVHNSSEPVHLGDFWSDAAMADATTDSLPRPQYACGGGGSVFSIAALAMLDLSSCIRRLHRQCSQSDWMIGQCAREGGVRFAPEHGCTCVKWHANTERAVRERLRTGSCSFLQFPNSPGSRGGPFKDLVPLLRAAARPPAVVHQLERLVR